MHVKGNILWVESDVPHIKDKVDFLEDCGHTMEVADSPKRAMELLTSDNKFDAVILDIMMEHGDEFDIRVTKGGHETGLVLARWIKKNFPSLPVVGCSVRDDEHIVKWFKDFGAGYWSKTDLRASRVLEKKMDAVLTGKKPLPNIFIVHGHDEKAKIELKQFIQNNLKLGEPKILHELPSQGRTIIEKFEDESLDIEIVFVLLTPDDLTVQPESEDDLRRARQNVIFEMGFFYGKLRRTSGRIILLHRGDLELPSDISGVIYIEFEDSIESVGEKIRMELYNYL